jgi:hypothetical protein
MSRAKIVRDGDGKFYGIQFVCPGCQADGHVGLVTLPVRWLPPGETESPVVAGQPHWDFDGNFDAPTFGPSVLQHFDYGAPDARKRWCCHSFVRKGRIQFLGDCTHALAGQTVGLPDMEEVAD